MKIRMISIAFLLVLLSACNVFPAVSSSLDGTSWELYAISKHRPIEGSNITLAFEDGQVSGSSGCNQFGGEYKVNGNQIEFGMLMSTLMACADPAMMEQETLFLQFLGTAQRFKMVDGQLQIFWSDHEALTFVPAE